MFTGGVSMAEAQQTLSDWPGWSIKKPGDQDQGHTFDQRVQRIGLQLGASWAQHDRRVSQSRGRNPNNGLQRARSAR